MIRKWRLETSNKDEEIDLPDIASNIKQRKLTRLLFFLDEFERVLRTTNTQSGAGASESDEVFVLD